MTLLPPGSDPGFAAFLGYWHLAFLVLCPLAWWLALQSSKPWMARAKRPVIGLLIAVALGSVLMAHAYAADASTVPNPDYCEQFRQQGYTWWELAFLGCW